MRSVTILGSGNAFNSDARAHAAYLLESTAGNRLLLDCGATTLYRLRQSHIDTDSLDHILLTHFHGDHYAGLPFVLLELDLICARRRPLTILGPVGVRAACEAIIEQCYPAFGFHFAIEYREFTIPYAQPQSISSFTIEAFPITHRPESLGYRVSGPTGRTFAFSGDSACDERLFALLDGVDLACVELTMKAHTTPPVTHVALDEVRRDRARMKARRLVFTHITDALARQVVAEGLGEAAYDGMVLEL